MNYTKKIPATITVAAVCWSIAQVGFSQPPGMRIISPEVQADRTITFRLLAPNAREVKVGGDFTRESLSMTKDESGIWSVTTKPLEPNIYGYNFTMDGLTMPDPNNTYVKAGVIWFGSQVDVSSEKPSFFAARDVPHGILHEHWYQSPALGTTRRVFVYTPPGYEASSGKTYPVLYLLHGMGDDEGTWTQVGRANFIMDNLLAEGKTRPALIVMPFGHASRTIRRGPSGGARGADASSGAGNRGGPVFGVQMLENDLLENIIPLIEREYRAGKDRNQRAIAGLSMGGYQALSIGLNNLQHFAYIGAFSSALLDPDFGVEFPALADPDKVNNQLKLLWIGCGADDRLMAGNQKLAELLTDKGIKHQWVVTPGYGHAWTLWRVYLRDLLPLVFVSN